LGSGGIAPRPRNLGAIQEPATGPYRESGEFSLYFAIESIPVSKSNIRLGNPSGLCPSGLPTKFCRQF